MKRTSSVFGTWLLIVLVAALLGASPAALAQGKAPQKAPAKKDAGKKQQPAAAPAAAPAPDYGKALDNLQFRSIGPAIMGGRIDDFAVVESNPSIIYVGVATGGIWKTVNAGVTWEPIFDDQSPSIGDIALAPSDPSILYVGTGESNNRQSSSWGNGVYKSLDAGETWQHIGLASTYHIGRVVVHPTNPNVVYVAAAGNLWGPSKERGVYKTTDGGKTWTQVLYVNDLTGVNDIAIDPQSPDTLYAGAYQRQRTVWGFNGGGPGSAIYKTTDGGATWKKLSKGLPYEKGTGDTGRIGIGIYRRNSNIVYALVEHTEGGIYRSEDKGETWTRMSNTNPRPMYYSQVHVDPNNDLRIWVLGANVFNSEDGGKTFTQNRGQRIHGDYHGFWIDPNDSNHMIAGTDGGIHVTWDSGRNWDFINTIPLGQFYEVSYSMERPYKVCGGLQDNGVWCGPASTLYQRGPTNDEWINVNGGDGYYAQIDSTDGNIVYAESQDGGLVRRDLKTGESKSIRPLERGDEARFRFQWNTPLAISWHDPKTIYYAGQYFFKSTNRGDDWVKISADLTNNEDRNKKPIMGRMPEPGMLSRFDGVQHWPCITTISESPLNAQVLWAGTDDGNLQISRDAGKSWKNVAEKVGVPKGTYVNRINASKYAEGTAYAAFDGHRMGDFAIYVFMTTDFGETWKDISSNLPRNNGVVHVIREHQRNPDLLFVGTEFGAYASFDRGASWTKIKMNFPHNTRVDDIQIHRRDNDLIFATHGRSIWILDDITPLEQMNAKVLESDLHLFDPRPATEWRLFGHKGGGGVGGTGAKYFIAPNPQYGAIINFYLKKDLAENERIRITIHDSTGKEIRRIDCGGPPPQAPGVGGPGGGGGGGGAAAILAALQGLGFAPPRCDPKAGLNRTAWDLRENSPIPPAGPGQGGPGGGGGGFGFGGAARGPLVEPGEYTVRIAHVTLPQAPRPAGGAAGAPAAMPAGEAPAMPAGGQGPGAGGPPQTKWETSKKVSVEDDPRVELTAADRAARREIYAKLTPVLVQATLGQRTVVALRANLVQAQESWRRPGAPRVPDDVRKAADDLLKKIDEVYPLFAQLPSEAAPLGDAGPPRIERPTPLPQRLGQIAGQIEGWSAPPTQTQKDILAELAPRVTDAVAKVEKLATDDLASLNKMMRDANIPYISAPPTGAGRGRRGGEPEPSAPQQ